MPYTIEVDDLKLQSFYAFKSIVEFEKDDLLIIQNEKSGFLASKIPGLNFIESKNTELFNVYKICCDHSKPITRIYLNGNLIFQNDLLLYDLKLPQTNDKLDKIYFRGLPTSARILDLIVLSIRVKDISCFLQLSIYLFLKVIKIVRIHNKVINTTKLYINLNYNGRDKRLKYCDIDYFREMAQFKFIYCPDGDYEWTYRVFESVLVGSLPVRLKKFESWRSGDLEYIVIENSDTVNSLKFQDLRDRNSYWIMNYFLNMSHV